MAQELATALKHGVGKGKFQHFPEGTLLTDLPNALKKIASERGILRQRLIDAEDDIEFAVAYDRAHELGLVDLSAEELIEAVKAADVEPEEEEEEETEDEDEDETE